MQHHAADQLDVIVALAQHPLGGLAHHGESFIQDVIQGLALGQKLAEFDRLGGELLVGKGFEFGLQRRNSGGASEEAFDLAVIG